MRSARLLYNPAAGRFPARRLLHRAVDVLRNADWDVEIVEIAPGQGLAEVASRAAEEACEAVFVAGGDGSVGKVAGALAGSETALGVLPAGTANVWAQELGLPHLDWSHWFALEDAAKRIARGEIRLVDVGECNARTFLLWAGVGLDGEIVNSIEPRERWEKVFPIVRYATAIIWSSLEWRGIELRVESGDEVWEDRYLIALASNIRSYAGGLMEMSPDAKVDDGLLDFWLIGGSSIKDAIVRLGQILLGRHVDAPGVVHFRSSRAEFSAVGSLPMQYDGEPAEQMSPVRFTVRPRSLRVIVPEGGWKKLFTSAAEAAE